MQTSLFQPAFLATAVATALLAGCATSPPTTAVSASGATSRNLIPREAIFGNPERAGARLSPDGKLIAFGAPRDGVMNLWVVERGRPFSEARPITNEKGRAPRPVGFTMDGAEFLFLKDRGGDENFQLHATNVKSGAVRLLTDFPGATVQLYRSSQSRPEEILIGLNNRDKAWHDPHLLNVRTGELKKLFDNKDRLAGFTADEDLNIRFVSRTRSDGGSEILRFDNGKTAPFEAIDFEDAQSTGTAGLSNDAKTLYWRESRGRDTQALVAIDLASGQRTVLHEDPRADIGGRISDPRTGRVLAVDVTYLKNEWRAIDPAIKPDLDYLNVNLKGTWGVQSQSMDNQVWIIGNDPVTTPVRALVYDRKAKTLTELYVARPALTGKPLPVVCPVEIKSRDGLTLVSYLTLPVGTDPDGDCRPNRPLPMVLDVHGGPWGRDDYGYDSGSTWFADRGYASLRVNFRSSTGFGKAFIAKGHGEWGRKMHDDLLDGVDWAVKNGIAQADKVAIYGGSYGGYATLWGMTNTPDRFACGVAVVAPSNIETLLAAMPSHWESRREQLYRRVGDPRTPEGKAMLKERSPLTHVAKIRKPLLIGQGANDPRVKQVEADQIVAAMEEKKIPVTYVLFPDEGHGFSRPPNRTAFFATTEAFLAQCLGGRFQPVGNDFKGSSITVPKGVQYVPGLAEAMAKK